MKNKIYKPWRQFFCRAWGGQAALALILLGLAGSTSAQTVTTVGGGSGTTYPGPYWGYLNGQYTRFHQPNGLAMDPAGNYMFVADYSNNVVRFMSSPATASRQTYTFTNSFTPSVTQGISRPVAVAVDAATNVFVLNKGGGNNGTLLQFNAVYLGYPTLVATNASQLINASALAMDSQTNLYVTVSNKTVLRITLPNTVSVVGVITNAGANLQGIAVMDNGQIALSDAGNNGIWLMNNILNNTSNSYVKLAGFNGAGDNADVWPVPATNAYFNHPANLAKAGNGFLVIADKDNHRVKLLNTASSTVTLLYGVKSNLWLTGQTIVIDGGSYKDPGGWVDGAAGILQGNAESRLPFGVVVAPDGTVYTSEDYCHLIRHVTSTGLAAPQLGAGPSLFDNLAGIALNQAGNNLFAADKDRNTIYKLDLTSNQTTAYLTNDFINHPVDVMLNAEDTLFVLNQNAGTNGSIISFDLYGNLLATNVTGLQLPTALTMDADGVIFVTEQNGVIRSFSPGISNFVASATNIVATVTNANRSLQGIAIFDDGNLAVSDAGNHVIWTLNPATNLIYRLTGQLGTNGVTLGASNVAKLYQPHRIAHVGGDQLVVADKGNNRLVTVSRAGSITNVLNSANANVWFGRVGDPFASGSPFFVSMVSPVGVAVSGLGKVFASENFYHDIRGLNDLLAGAALPPLFNNPAGINFDQAGANLYIADTTNNAIYKLDLATDKTTRFLYALNGISHPVDVLLDDGEIANVYVLNQNSGTNGSILVFDSYGNFQGTLATNLNQPTAFVRDGIGNIFVTEQAGNIQAVFPDGAMSTVATVTNAGVSLQGISLFDDGSLAVSDATNHVVWVANPITKLVSKLTGQLGTNGIAVGTNKFAQLNQPHHLARIGGNQLLIADTANHRLVTVSSVGTTATNGLVSTNATLWFGRATDPIPNTSSNFVKMVSPVGVAVNSGGRAFCSETFYKDIRGLTGLLAAPGPTPIVPLPGFKYPAGIAVDSTEAYLYIADLTNNTVQSLNLADNLTSTYLTTNNGIHRPAAVMLSTDDYYLYVLNQNDGTNGNILAFDPYGNPPDTLVTGLNNPTAFTLDAMGNIFVTEKAGAVRVFGAGVSNTIVTITTNASISLQGIGLFNDGSIAVSDAGNHVIWSINAITKTFSVLTGQLGTNGIAVGTNKFAKLNQPHHLTRIGGDQLLIADSGNHRLATVTRAGFTSTNGLNSADATVWFGCAGDPAATGSPKFVAMKSPVGVAASTAGKVFASETFYPDIRRLNGAVAAPGALPTVPLPFLNYPAGMAIDSAEANLYIADTTNNAVQVLNLGNNLTTTYLNSSHGIYRPASVLLSADDYYLYVLNQNNGTNGNILAFDPWGNPPTTIVTNLNNPTAFTLDAVGNIFVAEKGGAVRVVYPSGVSNTIVTINTNVNVSLQGIALFDDGNLAVSDAGNHVVWTVNALTKTVSLLTGQLGVSGSSLGFSNQAKLYQPHQLARVGGNQLLIADTANNRLVTVNRAGSVTNVLNSTNASVWFGIAGDPAAGGSSKFVTMKLPVGVAVSTSGKVFASEIFYPDIRGLTTPVVAPAAVPNVLLPNFITPSGIGFNGRDNSLYIADPANNNVQLLDLNSNLTSVFLTVSNGLKLPVSVVVDTNKFIPYIYVLNQNDGTNGSILGFDIYGNPQDTITTGLNLPTAFTMDGYGHFFVAEQAGAVRVFGAGISNTIVTLTNVSLQGIAIFDDSTLAVSDASNHVVLTINALTKAVTRLTGQPGITGTTMGSNNVAKLNSPHQISRVGNNQLLVADSANNRLLTVNRNGYITNVLNAATASIWFGQAGDPVGSGSPKFVPMVRPVGVAVGGGYVFASETYYGDIRGLTGSSVVAAQVNPGVPLPYFSGPAGIALNTGGTVLFEANPADNVVKTLTLADNSTATYLTVSNKISVPVDVALDSSDNLYVLNQGASTNTGFVLTFDRFGNLMKTNVANLSLPTALTLDNAGALYIAERDGGIRLITAAGVSNTITVIATNNVYLQGIALLDDGTITVSDTGNHVLWQVNPVSKVFSLFTGQFGTAGKNFGAPVFAKLNQPKRLTRAAGDLLLAADSGNNQVVVIDRSGSITNSLVSTNGSVWFGLAGDPVSASIVPMASPNGLALAAGGAVFASEENIYKDIRRMIGTGLDQLGMGGGGGSGTNAVIVPPSFSPNAGYFPMGQDIIVTSPNPAVFYTTDGTEPTVNSRPVVVKDNVKHIYWFNTTNDLTWLRVRAFVGTNGSATVSGQPVTSNNIGTPRDFNPMLQAGIGSSIVVPVVCNLTAGQQVKSYQMRYEVYPLNNLNTPTLMPLSIYPTNDFVPVVTATQPGTIGTASILPYTHTITNGLSISSAITNGNNGNTLFQHYAVVLMMEVLIPYTANEGDIYALNVLYPSATSDGFNGNVPLTAMPQTLIVVTNLPYTVGDSASAAGAWYNAGTFGDQNLDNADVNQAFFASSGLRTPYSFSDVFNAMDVYPTDSGGFVGGDGQIRFLDWQTILRRSLRLDNNNWSRAWSAGGFLVNFTTNLVAARPAASALETKASPVVAPWNKQALVGGNPVGGVAPGGIVNVPVYVKLQNGASVAGLQFRAVVTPQNGAPDITGAPQLNLAGGVSSPLMQQSFKQAEAAYGWQLGSFSYQSRSSNFLGWVSFTVPPTAQTGQTYTVSFANVDGAPDLATQYEFESRSATVTVGSPSPAAPVSSDEWKVNFFGSTTNPAAADNADPDDDGVPNWMEFLAGTDPTSAQSKLQVTISGTPASLHWLTAPGRAYELQYTTDLAGSTWSTLATVSGDGTVTTCPDVNPTGATRYYRLHILP